MSRSLFSPTLLTAPWLSCASLRLCLLDGNIHKENNLVLCVVMEQSRMEQRWQGEIANCTLLRYNIVMLDYPSACWHRPASPWTHNPAEKQPTANGVFYGGAVFCIYSAVRYHTCLCLWSSSFIKYVCQCALLWSVCRVTVLTGFCCPLFSVKISSPTRKSKQSRSSSYTVTPCAVIKTLYF